MRQCDKCKHRNECNTFKKSLTDDTKYLFGCDAFEEEDTAPKFDKVNLEKLTKMPEFDLEGYQSPIEIIYDKLTADFNIQLENNVMTAVQRYGINVDRDELIKALNYDRRQYEAGYRTAMLRYKAPRGEWITDDWSKIIECNLCKGAAPICVTSGEQYKSDFCPICGADMRPEEVDDVTTNKKTEK